MAELSRTEILGKMGAEYKQALIKGMAKAYGDRPSDAETISHERELALWMQPTSPAADKAREMGASPEEVAQADRMWAEGMKQQQQQMRKSGATPEQIHQAGLSDDAIFQACRKYAYERGKAHSGGDPAREVQWHAGMADRAARQMTNADTSQVGIGSQG